MKSAGDLGEMGRDRAAQSGPLIPTKAPGAVGEIMATGRF